ncbi:MAG: hypothetical protein QM681_02050 [Novosphingobium sp.]
MNTATVMMPVRTLRERMAENMDLRQMTFYERLEAVIEHPATPRHRAVRYDIAHRRACQRHVGHTGSVFRGCFCCRQCASLIHPASAVGSYN